ncbi:phosphoglycerate mutase family protein [Achlya hypogyna]|uniref:Phosphoglycerate mutase family protein n=1 Tax=Achlya hypogyna TaxID=1202772 RepID=A0A1V9ZN66_ACHHY|nr:phosphoglycerate mutase family protein [Achlya hypogyna]
MDKTIYFVRHGESTFNEWRTRSILTFSWIFVKDPMIIDAPLSRKGEQQVASLHQEILDKKLHETVELIITSPLTRAIQTTLGGFEGSAAPVQVHACCREMLDTACDIGRQPAGTADPGAMRNLNGSDLAAAFGALDFTGLQDYWWLPEMPAALPQPPTTAKDVAPLRETTVDVDRRIRQLLALLRDLPQRHIAVVCHSSFIKRATKATRKLANCEIHAIALRDLEALHP